MNIIGTLRSVSRAAGLAAALCIAGLACSAQTPEVCLHTAAGQKIIVGIEVARTPAERRLGLMYRTSLPDNRGMLFIADSEAVQPFTMHNTLIALDMVFIGSDRRIAGIVEHAQPLTEGPYAVKRPSLYVLEVNGGFCRQHGIAEGDTVTLVNIER